MHGSLSDLLHDWHDFHSLVGTASATLVGLMFVAASIGASVFNENHRDALRAFITPTVVHFSAVLLICILGTVPTHTWLTLSVVLGLFGLIGVTYSGTVLVQLTVRRRFAVDLSDRMFYALIPVLGYLQVLAAAVLLIMQSRESESLIAAALITLLVAGIRNAWDMTLWIMMRAPSPPGPSSPPSPQP
jgi:hypothetical protein